MHMGNSNTEQISIKTGGDIGVFVLKAHTEFNGDTLIIEAPAAGATGIHVANNTTDSQEQNLASVNINTNNTFVKAEAGLVAMS